MPLREELETDGNWLFRWRSYLPLVLIVPLLIELMRFQASGQNDELTEMWQTCCALVSFVGLAIRVKTVGHTPEGTSGRNTRQQVAKSLNTTGIYSVVRHPLYFGNFFMWLGIAMFCMSWQLVLIFVLAFWIYYERIMFAEEEFLRRKFGTEFVKWAQDRPAFLPRWFGWQRPDMPFSWRKVLRKEHTGLLGIVAAFYCIEAAEHIMVNHQPILEPFWNVLGTFSLLSYISIRVLKRWTHLLDARTERESLVAEPLGSPTSSA